MVSIRPPSQFYVRVAEKAGYPEIGGVEAPGFGDIHD
jgi:hypothetical protein